MAGNSNNYHPLKEDAAFFLTFADNAILTKLLKAILPDVGIKKIVENYYQKQIVDMSEGKGVRLDVYAKDSDGRIYDLEMQTSKDYDLGKRIKYYERKIDADQVTLRKGDSYRKLNEIYVIFVCAFIPFPSYNDLRSIYFFDLRERKRGAISLDMGLTGVIISTKAKWQKEDIPTDLKSFIAVLNEDYTSQPSEFAKELKDRLDFVNSNKEMELAMTQILTKTDEYIAKGEIKGKAEAIFNMMNAYHVSLEEAMQVAKVTEEEKAACLAEIARLQKEQ